MGAAGSEAVARFLFVQVRQVFLRSSFHLRRWIANCGAQFWARDVERFGALFVPVAPHLGPYYRERLSGPHRFIRWEFQRLVRQVQ
jgi:hypothetical protein